MFKNIYKNFFILIFVLFLTFLILITFNTKARNLAINSFLNFGKVYMTISMQRYLKSPEPNYALINDKLINFINISKKISSGNSRLVIGIYDAANLVQSSIIDDKKFGELEEFFFLLSNLDPNLYDVKTWYAKALYANNKIDDSINEVNKAINLSPIDPDPYRLALKIFSDLKDFEKFNFYCKKFLNSEFGGKQKRYQFTKFQGMNFNDFAVNLESENNNEINNYIVSGINQGELDSYELIPKKSTKINSIELIFNFNPGTVMEIENLKLFSKNNIYTIEGKDIYISSKNTFFNQNQIIFTERNNEILNLKFNRNFENIDKVIFSLKFDKLNIVNKNCK